MPSEIDQISKPFWDKSRPGSHPALRSLKRATPKEIEQAEANKDKLIEDVQVTSASMGRGAMPQDQVIVHQALSAVGFHQMNLEAFLAGTSNTTEARRIQIDDHRRSLANALLTLGRFDEALNALSNLSGKALPNFGEQYQKIVRIAEGVSTPNCECSQDVANPGVEQAVIVSPKTGRISYVHECPSCQMLNVFDRDPLAVAPKGKPRPKSKSRRTR